MATIVPVAGPAGGEPMMSFIFQSAAASPGAASLSRFQQVKPMHRHAPRGFDLDQ
jgi:hypothetical protein